MVKEAVSGECQEKALSPNLEEEGEKPIQLHVTRRGVVPILLSIGCVLTLPSRLQ